MGAEIMTRKELAEEWISTLLRGDSNLARLRVDPLLNFVLAFETRSLKQLTAAGNDVEFKPGEALGNLHCLFSDLVAANLAEGKRTLTFKRLTWLGHVIKWFQLMLPN